MYIIILFLLNFYLVEYYFVYRRYLLVFFSWILNEEEYMVWEEIGDIVKERNIRSKG